MLKLKKCDFSVVGHKAEKENNMLVYKYIYYRKTLVLYILCCMKYPKIQYTGHYYRNYKCVYYEAFCYCYYALLGRWTTHWTDCLHR